MLEVRNLTKEYRVYEEESGIRFFRKKKRITALDNISFTVPENRNVGILGRNGAGKSTLIKLLCGIISPTRGEIWVDSKYRPFEKKREYLKKISLVSGNKTQLNYDLSARDNFRFLGALYGIDRKTADKRAGELADCLGACHLIDRQIRKMSFGERLKMEVTAALLHDPKYIFLDEPTIGLDVRTQEQLRKFLRNYNNGSRILFLTSHNLDDISTVCDDILFIDKRRVDYFGSLSEFCSAYSAVSRVELTVREADREKIYAFLKKTDGLTSCMSMEEHLFFEVSKNRQAEILSRILENFHESVLYFDTANADVSAVLREKMMEGEKDGDRVISHKKGLQI